MNVWRGRVQDVPDNSRRTEGRKPDYMHVLPGQYDERGDHCPGMINVRDQSGYDRLPTRGYRQELSLYMPVVFLSTLTLTQSTTPRLK
jgi:hypothetical protein